MIPGFLLGILYVGMNFLVHLLPVWDIPTVILDALTLVWSYMVTFSFLTPLGAVQGALALVMTGTIVEVGIYIALKIITAITNRKLHH